MEAGSFIAAHAAQDRRSIKFCNIPSRNSNQLASSSTTENLAINLLQFQSKSKVEERKKKRNIKEAKKEKRN